MKANLTISDITPRLVRRFEKSYIQTSGEGCWEWALFVNRKGYGHFAVRQRPVRAHRVAWMIAHGEIPDTLLVCHKCDNRKCVRPSHLFLGTNQDNINDCVAKGRWPGPPRRTKR